MDLLQVLALETPSANSVLVYFWEIKEDMDLEKVNTVTLNNQTVTVDALSWPSVML